MKLFTRQFGEIEFSSDKVLKFPDGILGFEELKDFLLIKEDEEFFFWLTSVDKPEIIFPLIGISLIDSQYPKRRNNESFGIVKLDKEPTKITVNLKAPVYINQNKKSGVQVILDNDKYSVNYNLFKE